MNTINPTGDVAIVTLWSRPETVRNRLITQGIDCGLTTSRIAVLGTLYGNGLPHLLRNLLWNPQIDHLVVVGKNLSGSQEALLGFFERGIEEVIHLGTATHRITGSRYTIDGTVIPAMFKGRLLLYSFGEIQQPATLAGLKQLFFSLPVQTFSRIERVNINMVETKVERYPAEPRAHTIIRSTPLDAWRELIFRLVRFGYRSVLKKGVRVELQNVKVIIQVPKVVPKHCLVEWGFSLDIIRAYQESILDASPHDGGYNYGHRLRGYFEWNGQKQDSLKIAIQRLQQDPESRHVYISLWDNAADLTRGSQCPCLVTLFLRKFDHQLTLTATFRVHNALDGWLVNLYGLIAIQDYVSEHTKIPVGPITVISHSISVAGDDMVRAKTIADAKVTDDVIDVHTGQRAPRMDPNGYFVITADLENDELVATHMFDGRTLTKYRGKSAKAIEQQLARDGALSDISHALFVGRELYAAEMRLK